MAEKAEKKAFLLYYDWETLFDSLDNNEEAGELIKALFAFAKRGEITEFSGALKMAFIVMSQQLARDCDKWDKIKEKRREAINKRWQKEKDTKDTNEYNCIQMNTNEYKSIQTDTNDTVTVNVNDTVNDTVNVNVNGNVINNMDDKSSSAPAKTVKRFEKPSLDEVKAYCQERHNSVNAERFVDYYEANGWKVGKNPMKDWKAAVRTWEKNGYSNDSKSKDDADIDKYKFVINKF